MTTRGFSTDQSMDAELSRLLDSDVGRVEQRAARLYDELHESGAPLLLFGAGGLGRKTQAALAREGISIAAFADNNPRAHGTKVGGVEVLSPAEAALRFGSTGVFLVTVFLGSEAVSRQLKSLGCRTVVPFYPLFWKYADRLLPHYAYDLPQRLLAAADRVRQAWSLLGDEGSRREYLAQVRWRLDPETADLPEPASHDIYFPPDLFDLRADELFVDCGGYDGDSLRSFLAHAAKGFGGAVVFEPDPANFSKLTKFVETIRPELASRIELHGAATGATRSVLRLETRSSTASSLSGEGDVEVPCLTIDDVLGRRASTFIKMDIEGAELDALAGARAQILAHRPLLAISAYHCQDHLWQIPLLVRDMRSDYRFYLRRYSPEAIDSLVLYAVPEGRCLPRNQPFTSPTGMER